MPVQATAVKLDDVRHEEFCLPRPGADKPRIEGFLSYSDDEGGRSKATHFVTRCLECGAASYRPNTTV